MAAPSRCDRRSAAARGSRSACRSPRSIPSAERAGKTPTAAADRQILIVEDEPEIAQMLVEVLAPLGHRVEVAPTGRQALERLSAARYDVVLTDLRMPASTAAGCSASSRRAIPATRRAWSSSPAIP